MSGDKDRSVDLWMKQSQLFWQTVQQTPVLAGAIFAGWFALDSAEKHKLATGALVVGVLSMVVQLLVLRRMSQYLNTFRSAASRQIPEVAPPPWGLTGYRLGIAVPGLIAVFFLAVLIWTTMLDKNQPKPCTSGVSTHPVDEQVPGVRSRTETTMNPSDSIPDCATPRVKGAASAVPPASR